MSEGNVTKYYAKLAAKEGLHIHATVRTHSLDIDEPKDLGGTDNGPSPVELVLAALGSCQEIVIRFYGKKYGIDVESVETTVEGDLNLGGLLGVKGIRPGFQSVKASTKVKATGDPEKVDRLLKIAEERCPVLDILQKGVPVEVNIERT